MKNRLPDILTVALFCGIVFLLSAAFVLLPAKDFSPDENRALEQKPEFTASRLFDGSLTSDVNGWFSDQFPARGFFLKLRAAAETALFKRENNGVIDGDGIYAVRSFNARYSRRLESRDTDGFYEEAVKAQLENIGKLGERLDIPLYTVIPPRTVDIAAGDLRGYSPVGDITACIRESIPKSAGYIDTFTPLKAAYDAGEYVYYRTDHHWTAHGAYIAYTAVMQSLGNGANIIPESEFTAETVDGFVGTTGARAQFPFMLTDTLTLMTRADDGEYEVTADGKPIDGFFVRKWLAESDKYSVYLDGTHGVTTVRRAGGGQRKTLLIYKDSFANSLIPYLAREYDIIALDLKTNVALSVGTAADLYGADAALIVYNAENLITTVELGVLK